MLNACTPVTRTGLSGDKAHAGNHDVWNVPPARAGNSTDPHFSFQPQASELDNRRTRKSEEAVNVGTSMNSNGTDPWSTSDPWNSGGARWSSEGASTTFGRNILGSEGASTAVRPNILSSEGASTVVSDFASTSAQLFELPMPLRRCGQSDVRSTFSSDSCGSMLTESIRLQNERLMADRDNLSARFDRLADQRQAKRNSQVEEFVVHTPEQSSATPRRRGKSPMARTRGIGIQVEVERREMDVQTSIYTPRKGSSTLALSNAEDHHRHVVSGG